MKKIFFAAIFLLTVLQAYSLEINFFDRNYSIKELENLFKKNNISYEKIITDDNDIALRLDSKNQSQELTLCGYKINSLYIVSKVDNYYISYNIQRKSKEDTGSDLLLELVADKKFVIKKSEKTGTYYAKNKTSLLLYYNLDREEEKKYNMCVELFMSIDK